MSERLPSEGEYLEGKLWYQRKGSILTIGLTHVAVNEVGSVESIEFPDEGEDCKKGEVVATVDGSNGNLEVVTPATGVIYEVNRAVQDEPDRVSDDPEDEGWLFKLEMQDSSSRIKDEDEDEDETEDEEDGAGDESEDEGENDNEEREDMEEGESGDREHEETLNS